MQISANELKTKGVSAITSRLGRAKEAIITVRGKERYVVMDMEQYNYLRECELEAALNQAKADLEAGRFVTESVGDHIKRVTHDL
ncbi:MAG: hypothetical protein JEZ11_26845 [Desulfobacterales bacterium]|nr:hypothetical protein [Desulfobacterales bacterium]